MLPLPHPPGALLTTRPTEEVVLSDHFRLGRDRGELLAEQVAESSRAESPGDALREVAASDGVSH